MRTCFCLLAAMIILGLPACFAACPIGDMDGDCSVGLEDLYVIANSWLADNDLANLNGIGRVDLSDFIILSDNWGKTGYPLVINEVMADNSSTIEDSDEAGEYPDWIEIYNPGSIPIDIGGMWLTDTLSTPKMRQIPTNAPAKTTIQPGGYLIIWADDEPTQGPLHVKFKLSPSGEAAGLSDSAGNLIDSVSFGSLGKDESYGRYPNGGPGWQKFSSGKATPGSSNGGESTDPGIVINEIMYHPGHEEAAFVPEPTQLEYIEIVNKETSAVNLGGWRLVDGVSYTVPADTIIGAGNYLVIAADTAAFAAKYPTVANVIGGWVGKLSNNGESITLVNTIGTVIDSVHYSNEGDWAQRLLGPVDYYHRGWIWSGSHNGGGKSLELISYGLSNEYGQNWKAGTTDQGTPGRPNSVFAANIAPLILDAKHTPLVPSSSEPVTVTARIKDEINAGISVSLRWRVDTSVFVMAEYPTYNAASYTTVTMFDDGLHGDGQSGDGIYGAFIPAQADKKIIEFFVEAIDSSSNTRTWPAPCDMDGTSQQTANMLYQVDDGFVTESAWKKGKQPIYYIIMTEAQRGRLQEIGDGDDADEQRYSNAQMNATFISIDGTDTQIRYALDVRNRGEGSRRIPPNNYRVKFRSDDLWKNLSAINLNSKYTYLQVAGSAIFQQAGIVTADATAVQLRVNGVNLALTDTIPSRMYGTYVHVESVDSDFTAHHYPDDGDGNAYKASKYPQIADLTYLGTDPQTYVTRGYTKATNESENDWTDLFELTNVLQNEPDATYLQRLPEVVNTDQWIRWFAAQTLIGNNETNLGNGYGDDYRMYRGILDPRFTLIAHDNDTILGLGDNPGSATASIWQAFAPHSAVTMTVIKRFLQNPEFTGKYYAELKKLTETVFAPATINPLLDSLLSGFVPDSQISVMKQFVVDRNAYVLSQIPLSFTATTTLSMVNGYYKTTAPAVAVSGTANAIETRAVRVNGLTATWVAVGGTWSCAGVPLKPGINRLIVQTFGDPEGLGTELKRMSLNVWYDDGTQGTLSGTLAANTTLDVASGPWHITGNVIIPAGVTLTIQPGTTLFFDAGTGITVNGQLIAEGSDFAQIQFAGVPGSAGWGNVTINGSTGSPETRMAYMVFEGNGGPCIHSVTGSLFLDHVTFGNTACQYVSVDNSSFLISHCVFPKTTAEVEPMHGTGGIRTGGRGIIRDCFFGGTTGYKDLFDFTGGNRNLNEPILELYNNVFMDATDDCLDIDGTDAWIEGNIFAHCHRNGAPDSSAGVSGGNDSGNTSEITILGNIFYDCDSAATAKQGNFFTLINNTIVHTTKTGGQDFDSGVVNVRDTTPDVTTFGAGFYLEGNIIVDAEQLVRNYDTAQTMVTFNNNILPFEWDGPGSGNSVCNPVFKHIPQLTETHFTSWQQAQILRDWFSLQPDSAACGTLPNGLDFGGVIPFGASIADIPDSVTHRTDAVLHVGSTCSGYGIPIAGFPLGSGFTHYQWRLDANDWSPETAITQPILLTGLAEGSHYVEVIGKNDAGRYQNDSVLGTNAVVTKSAAWTVNTSWRTLRINEILASNTSLVHEGTYPDMIELYYDGPAAIDLGGYHLTDNKDMPAKFTFTPGTTMNPGTYRVIYADTNTTSGIHTGFAINSNSDDLTLTDPAGSIVDSVKFGPQLPDKSIGRIGNQGRWTLTEPTFGTDNKIAPKGDPRTLKINEWFADGNIMFTADWLEIYNPDIAPVDMGGLYLTDNPVAEPNKCPIRPLSFVAGSSFAKLSADTDFTFRLSADGEMLGLINTDLTEIDKVIYGPQSTDVSQGRTPDGSTTLAFFSIPTPGVSNPTVPTTVSVTTTLIPENASKKVLVPTAAVNAAWKGGADFDDSTWNSGVFVAGKAGGVGYENNTGDTVNYTDLITYDIKSVKTGTCYIRVPFTLTAEQVAAVSSLYLKIRRDDGFIAYINGVTAAQSSNVPAAPAWNSYATSAVSSDTASRQLAGYVITNTSVLSSLKVGQNILAIHGMDATSSSDMIISFILEIVTQQTEGEDTLASCQALIDGLRITEIMYNPAGDGNAEYIELQNISSTALDLTGVRLAGGIDFTFPVMTLAPQQYTLVVAQQAAFETRYGTALPVAGVYTGKLSNAGEQIILKLANPLDAAILRFDYKNGWYPLTDGGGYSLVVHNPAAPAADWQDKENWGQSIAAAGSPGRADTAPVIINEVLAHAHDLAPDWIELYNTTDAPINLGGWTLSDNVANLAKYRIADNTIIEPNSYLVFHENTQFGNSSDPGSLVQFAFSENGDSAYLTANTGDYTTEVLFGASETGVSFGRYQRSNGTTDFVLMSDITDGKPNAKPRTGPIIISEMMYNPPTGGMYPSDDYEYIELHNITASPVALNYYDPSMAITLGWRFTAGVEFTFPVTTTIPANGYLVIARNPAAFAARYGSPSGVQILGPFENITSLANGGDRLELSRPGDTDLLGIRYYITADAVRYNNEVPWPAAPNGGGQALGRINETGFGDDVINWQSCPATPGL